MDFFKPLEIFHLLASSPSFSFALSLCTEIIESISDMAKGEKFVVVGEKARSRSVVEAKGKRVALRTREAVNFDPKPCVLRSQKEVDEYLATYDIHLPSNIEVEWCPAETDVTASPPTGGVYFLPRSLLWGEASSDPLF